MSVRIGVTPDIFHFLMGHKEHAKNVFGGVQEHTADILTGDGALYMVHTTQMVSKGTFSRMTTNIHRWCTCMDIYKTIVFSWLGL